MPRNQLTSKVFMYPHCWKVAMTLVKYYIHYTMFWSPIWRSKKEPQVQVQVRLCYTCTFILHTWVMHVHVYLQQRTSLKLPGCINHYRLSGVIIYRQRTKTSGHYTAFVSSGKDSWWFYVNDAQVHIHSVLVHVHVNIQHVYPPTVTIHALLSKGGWY